VKEYKCVCVCRVAYKAAPLNYYFRLRDWWEHGGKKWKPDDEHDFQTKNAPVDSGSTE